jgi:hypothetical protein
MTMQSLPHPDDELLAAYAGGDPDVVGDAPLVAHLSACDRCRPVVDELSLLRTALGELPDLAPSRPLRLIPPVSTPVTPVARRSWLRRLTAPAMAAGAGLFLVGALGLGVFGGMSSAFSNLGENLKGGANDQGGLPAAAPSSGVAIPGDTSTGYLSSRGPRSVASPTPPLPTPIAPRPSAEDAAGRTHDLGGGSPDQPWLTLLIAGIGLFGISAGLRFSISPRAG